MSAPHHPRNGNFKFHQVDIYNKKYNPKGAHASFEYTFPFGDQSFDFVFLTSVFTHMLPRDLERYLAEISRVLKVGRRCLITFFLLNEDSRRLIDAQISRRTFPHELEGCRVKDRHVPEREVAYDEGSVRKLYAQYRLNIIEPIRYGKWSGRCSYLSFQDIVIAERTA